MAARGECEFYNRMPELVKEWSAEFLPSNSTPSNATLSALPIARTEKTPDHSLPSNPSATIEVVPESAPSSQAPADTTQLSETQKATKNQNAAKITRAVRRSMSRSLQSDRSTPGPITFTDTLREAFKQVSQSSDGGEEMARE